MGSRRVVPSVIRSHNRRGGRFNGQVEDVVAFRSGPLVALRPWVTRLVVLAMVAVLGVVANVSVATVTAGPARADASTGEAGVFVAAQGRLLDTRTTTPLSAGISRLVQVTGQAGIPATDVAAVAVTVTAVEPTSSGYLWAAADGAAGGSTSVLSYGPVSSVSGTVSNSAMIAVSPTTGKIQVQSNSTVNVIVDVQGYYTAGTSTTAGGFVPTFPTRIAFTADGTQLPQARINPGVATTVQVTGNGGVPAGASAAFVSIAVRDYTTTSKGFFRVYAAGGSAPTTSTNYEPGAWTNSGTVVPLSAGGAFTFIVGGTGATAVDVAVDVQGYYTATNQNAAFTPASARVFDGRSSNPVTQVPAGGTSDIQVAGTAGVPQVTAGLTAAALNLQVLAGSASGYITAYASDTPPPKTGTSAVSFASGDTRGNLTMVKIGDNGKISIYNSSTQPITMVIDLQGWYTGVRNTAIEVGPRYNATRLDFPVSDRVQASVDVGSGNLQVTTTELTAPGIDNDVQLGMTYNSLALGSNSALSKGAGGFGWTHRLGQDTKLMANTDGSVLYLAPSGTQGKYVPSSATAYRSPVGFKNTLTKTSGGWEIKDKKTNAISYFDAAGRLNSIKNGDNQYTTLTYNTSGYLTSVAGTQGGVSKTITVTPNPAGRTTGMSQTTATSGSRSVAYTYTGQQIATITDAASRVTTFTYASIGGDLASIAMGGGTTSFTYDSNHRVTTVTRTNGSQAAVVTRFAYTSDTQTLVAAPATDQGQPVTAVPKTTYTLNSLERVTSTLDPAGRLSTTTYNDASGAANADKADVTGRGVTGGGTTAGTYGANDGESLTKVQSPTGASMSMTYGTGPNDKYLPTGVTDTQGTGRTYSYNGAGNALTGSNTPGAANASVNYNGDGTLQSSKDPLGYTTTYTADSGNHRTTEIVPPASSTLGKTVLGYDGYGRVNAVTDGRGAVATYTYNLLDQVTGISYSGTSLPATTAMSFTYNGIGKMKTRTDASGTTTWTYDPLGRERSRVNTAGGGTLSYDYDRNGNVTGFEDPRGITTYTYDAANRLTSRTGTDGTDYYAYNNADGKRTDTWWRSNAAHTTFAAHTRNSYDISGRLRQSWTSRASNDATRVFDTSYCYSKYSVSPTCPNPSTSAASDTGLIQWSTNNLTGKKTFYEYDTSDRLTKAETESGSTYSYTYDKNGNRKTRVVGGSTTQTLTFNSGNLITSGGYGYDQAGNTTTDPTNGAIRYNTAGQMISAGGATTTQNTYAGDGQNELTNQTLPGGTTMTYAYGKNTPEGVPTLDSIKRGTDTTYIENEPTTGRAQALNLSTGENAYLVTDNVGSVVALISSASGNNVLATYSYDPYGVITASTGTGLAATSNLYRQGGGLRDPLTGWDRHGTRYHNTAIGRWISVDPITRLNDPDKANPYSYVSGNPINNTDPTGKLDWDAFGWISAGYGVLTAAWGVYGLATLAEDASLLAITGTAGLAVVGIGFAIGGIFAVIDN